MEMDNKPLKPEDVLKDLSVEELEKLEKIVATAEESIDSNGSVGSGKKKIKMSGNLRKRLKLRGFTVAPQAKIPGRKSRRK